MCLPLPASGSGGELIPGPAFAKPGSGAELAELPASLRTTGTQAPPPVGMTTPIVFNTNSSISTWLYSSFKASFAAADRSVGETSEQAADYCR